MSEKWDIVKLGDYCTKIGSGSTPRGGKNIYLDKGEYVLIRSQNIYNGYFDSKGIAYISKEEANKLRNVSVEKNDILLNITGDSVARVCLAPFDYLPARVNQHVAIIRCDGDQFNSEYLCYYLVSPKMQGHLLQLAEAGATRNALTKAMIEQLQVPKPDLAIQNSIAKILSSLDEKIELNNQINETLEQMAQALFKSWFVDFEPVRAKAEAVEAGNEPELAAMQVISGKSIEELERFAQSDPEAYQELAHTASLFPSEFVESELGMIPMGWEVRRVSDIVERQKVKKRYKKEQVVEYGKHPVLEQGENILLGFHNFEPSICATLSDPVFIFGDHTCVMKLLNIPFDISENVIAIKGYSYPTYWVYYATKGKQIFQEYRRHWAEFIIKQSICPTLELAEEFSKRIKIIYENNNNIMFENQELKLARETLLPKLLSGEIEISGNER